MRDVLQCCVSFWGSAAKIRPRARSQKRVDAEVIRHKEARKEAIDW